MQIQINIRLVIKELDAVVFVAFDQNFVGLLLGLELNEAELRFDDWIRRLLDHTRDDFSELGKHSLKFRSCEVLFEVLGENVGFVDVLIVLFLQEGLSVLFFHGLVDVQRLARFEEVPILQVLKRLLGIFLILEADEGVESAGRVLPRQDRGDLAEFLASTLFHKLTSQLSLHFGDAHHWQVLEVQIVLDFLAPICSAREALDLQPLSMQLEIVEVQTLLSALLVIELNVAVAPRLSVLIH